MMTNFVQTEGSFLMGLLSGWNGNNVYEMLSTGVLMLATISVIPGNLLDLQGPRQH